MPTMVPAASLLSFVPSQHLEEWSGHMHAIVLAPPRCFLFHTKFCEFASLFPDLIFHLYNRPSPHVPSNHSRNLARRGAQ